MLLNIDGLTKSFGQDVTVHFQQAYFAKDDHSVEQSLAQIAAPFSLLKKEFNSSF